MFSKQWMAALVTGGALLVAPVGSSAATITSLSVSLPGSSTGTFGPVSSPSPNNDDVPGASPNVIPMTIFFNSSGVFEGQFFLAGSGGTTEYRFTETVFNPFTAPWTGFRFELGTGTGSSFVQTGSVIFDLLNGNSTATSSEFTLDSHSPRQLDWTVASPPLSASFVFAIDVPDGMSSFTLRQTPLEAAAVPEPSTLALAAISLFAFARRKK